MLSGSSVTRPMTNDNKSNRGFLNLYHTKDVGFNYYEHLKFTWMESIRALGMSLVMFIHGIFPPLFDLLFSEYIKKAQERIDKINARYEMIVLGRN